MSIKETKSKKLYKEYSLLIPFQDIDNEINKKINNLLPTITIPGFRKGKAPINIVRKKYEDSLLNEVVQSVVSAKTSDLIKEKKLNLFRQPKIDLKKFEKNNPVEVEIKIDLQPEIKKISYNEIKLNKYTINPSKKYSDELFKKFIQSQKSYKKITNNREIVKKDRVTINFKQIT